MSEVKPSPNPGPSPVPSPSYGPSPGPSPSPSYGPSHESPTMDILNFRHLLMNYGHPAAFWDQYDFTDKKYLLLL